MSMNLNFDTRGEVMEAIAKNINIESAFADITDFILYNFDVGQIVGEDVAIEYVRKHHDPEEVFPRSDLEDWALANGFVREA